MQGFQLTLVPDSIDGSFDPDGDAVVFHAALVNDFPDWLSLTTASFGLDLIPDQDVFVQWAASAVDYTITINFWTEDLGELTSDPFPIKFYISGS